MQLGTIPWAYMLEQQAQQQAPAQGKKKSGGGLGSLLGMFSGIIGDALGEPPVGDFAPNIQGMEGMSLEPGINPSVVPALPSDPPAPQAGVVVPPTPTPAVPPTTAPSAPIGHPYMAPSPLQRMASTYTPGEGQMVPVPPMAVAYGPPAPGDPFAAIQGDPRYVNRIPSSGPGALDLNNVREVHLHDRGGKTPHGGNYKTLPYHVEVQPSGQIQQTRGADQMGAGSYKSNPRTLHVAYGDKVGALPTRQGMSSLQRVYETLKMHNPSWQFPSHGQAFNATQSGPWRASVSGRGLDEARWRGFLR